MNDLQNYGTKEVNPLASNYHKTVTRNVSGSVKWNDARLATVVRFRLVSDPGFPAWDVSYCHGQLRDGTFVEVTLPFSQLPKRGWKRALVKHARRDGVFAQGLGFFDNVSTLC